MAKPENTMVLRLNLKNKNKTYHVTHVLCLFINIVTILMVSLTRLFRQAVHLLFIFAKLLLYKCHKNFIIIN